MQKRPEHFDPSFLAKLFYVSMHLICWMSLILYKNSFREEILQLHTIFFIICVALSNYLFFNTTNNPGYIVNDADNSIQLDDEQQLQQDNVLFCQKCNVNRPYRSKHCGKCKKCVAKFDHHCFWIGGCVGELNQRLFWAFLVVQSLALTQLELYFFNGLDCYEYSSVIDGKIVYSQEYGTFIVLSIIMGALDLFTLGLWVFHSYLIVIGSTTYELNKRRSIPHLNQYPPNFNPFDLGVFRNIGMTFLHGNKLHQWELPPIQSKQSAPTIFTNEYYNCC